MEPWSPWGETHEAALAGRLGLDVMAFVEAFGAGWELADTGEDRLPSPDVDGDWHVTGEPPQLMLRVDGPGEAVVARPVGRWCGPGRLSYAPTDPHRLVRDPADDSATIAALVRARRASFRYCVLCRRLTPPEYREGAECMGCQSRWRGVVY